MANPKPGLHSTEFSLTALLTGMAALKSQVGELSSPELYALTAIIISYVLSRAWVKAMAAKPAPLVGERIGLSET